MTVLKLLGAAIIFGVSLYFLRAYRRFLHSRISECESFLLFIEHMQREIGCRLRPVGEILQGYRDEVLKGVGFLKDKPSDISSSYLECENKLSVGREGKEILKRLFRDLGKSYKEGTLALLEEARGKLLAYTEGVRGSLDADVKLAAALIFGGGVGLLLLLL